ncbi:hypothetical protein HF521_014126 [Silurus meridionalis]|uniref:Uncharacterized protein n=1 Tax=Silurus meridionalis TaxID=175797 RepID=A0A8T0A860_SILME|nr:hypothetical protein HF521_014126 [Silurus meridionalis]
MSAESDKLKFYINQSGNTLGAQLEFIERLKQRRHLRQVYSEEECDVIFAFVPIASRAGTDIETALQKITQTSKPILLVVFHHTFDPNFIAPDSKWFVKREDVFVVDILFYEDEGLLRCPRNDMALKSATDFLMSVRAPPDILLIPVNPRPQRRIRICVAVFVLAVLLTVCIYFLVISREGQNGTPTTSTIPLSTQQTNTTATTQQPNITAATQG